jgi:hypothetical protein
MKRMALEMVEEDQRKRQYSRHTTPPTVTPSLVGHAAFPRTQISFIVAKEGTCMHRRPPLKHPRSTRSQPAPTAPTATDGSHMNSISVEPRRLSISRRSSRGAWSRGRG